MFDSIPSLARILLLAHASLLVEGRRMKTLNEASRSETLFRVIISRIRHDPSGIAYALQARSLSSRSPRTSISGR